MDDVLISVLAIAFLFGTPAILGLIGGVVWRQNTLSKYREREKARAMYERLVTEKLDVIKTGLVMGMTRAELDHLDQRLEQLIGTDKMMALLDEKQPATPAAPQVPAADLESEIEGIKQASDKQGTRRN
jgi:hypothetical protein